MSDVTAKDENRTIFARNGKKESSLTEAKLARRVKAGPAGKPRGMSVSVRYIMYGKGVRALVFLSFFLLRLHLKFLLFPPADVIFIHSLGW